jgi:hypothetical protein
MHTASPLTSQQYALNQGVIPATIAVKNGVFKAGLHSDEMEDLARSGEEGRASKCSTRDLPIVASSYYRQRYENNPMRSKGGVASENTQWGGMSTNPLLL